MPDAGPLSAHLAELRRPEVAGVYGYCRRALGAAIAFQRAESKAIFKGNRSALWKFLRAGHHVLQAAKVFWFAAADVCLQECRRCQQKRDAILADQRADGPGFERAGMEPDSHQALT